MPEGEKRTGSFQTQTLVRACMQTSSLNTVLFVLTMLFKLKNCAGLSLAKYVFIYVHTFLLRTFYKFLTVSLSPSFFTQIFVSVL